MAAEPRAPRFLAPYRAYFSRALSAHLAYSTAIWFNLAATAAGFSLTVLVWRYVQPADASSRPFFAYLVLAFACNFCMAVTLERHVGERIREGLIATDLLKPVDLVGLFLTQALSDVSYQAFFALGAVGLAALHLGPALLPASAESLGFAALSVPLAFVVQFHLCFLFVQMIFLTHSNYGPFTTRMLLHNAFAGTFAPLDHYPETLQRVAMALPFHHVIYTPCALYQGRLAGAAAWQALGGQAAWAVALIVISRASFGRIRRSLTIQGG